MANVKPISVDELQDILKGNEPYTVVETLDEEEFSKGHIPGAINIPSGRIVREAKDKISKDEIVVVYCADEDCEASEIAAKKLADTGYSNVLDFAGGKKAWTEAGLKLEN